MRKHWLLTMSVVLGMTLVGCLDSNDSSGSKPDDDKDDGTIAVTTDGVGENEHRIFVTSTSENAGFGGATGGNTWCQGLASAAGLERTYKAMLSTTDNDMIDLIASNGGIVYIFSDDSTRIKVADSLEDMFLGDILANVNYTDEYSTYTGQVWTGSNADGTFDSAGNNCANWAASDASANGAQMGEAGGSLSETIESTTNTSVGCNNSHPVYCVSQ
jgi:hypothetical protein